MSIEAHGYNGSIESRDRVKYTSGRSGVIVRKPFFHSYSEGSRQSL
jgi:hypothetical protein